MLIDLWSSKFLFLIVLVYRRCCFPSSALCNGVYIRKLKIIDEYDTVEPNITRKILILIQMLLFWWLFALIEKCNAFKECFGGKWMLVMQAVVSSIVLDCNYLLFLLIRLSTFLNKNLFYPDDCSLICLLINYSLYISLSICRWRRNAAKLFIFTFCG